MSIINCTTLRSTSISQSALWMFALSEIIHIKDVKDAIFYHYFGETEKKGG